MTTLERPRLDVGIIGCGVAGGAAALLLAKAGHRVTVYERDPAHGADGPGVILQPLGQQVLARLNLLETVRHRSAILKQVRCETASRKLLFQLSYEALSPDFAALGTHPAVLSEALVSAISSAGIRCEQNRDIERLDHLDDGTAYVVDETGRRRGPYQLVIVADGARSSLREGLELAREITRSAWGNLWFIGFDPEQRFRDQVLQRVDGARRRVGVHPIGPGPRHGPGISLASLTWSIREDELEDWLEGGVARWRQEVVRLAPSAAALLDQIVSPEQLTFAPAYRVQMYPWHGFNTVYLGDAGHAMPPLLGQGPSFALYDAAILADCLEAQPDLPTALEAYSQARRNHLRCYQRATRVLTPFFQSSLEPLAWVRDLTLAALRRVPSSERQLMSLIAGYKQGAFTASLPLPGEPSKAIDGPVQPVG